MKKMSGNVIAIIIALVLVFLTLVLVINQMEESLGDIPNHEMSLNCCDGDDCTDTYYDTETNQCHLVLCEQARGLNDPNCVYEGEGILVGVRE